MNQSSISTDRSESSGAPGLFSIVPRHVVAGSGMTPPSETVTMLAIGAGGRAASDIQGLEKAGVRFLALCDVDAERSAKMREEHAGVPFFGKYREMLDRHGKEADAVLIAVPDHWHARMAIDCLDSGKHVMCEKPLAQTVREMDDILAAAKRHPELVTQAMNQGHAYDTIRDFREWVEAGLIGEVTEAHIWCPAVYSFMDQLDELKKDWPIPGGLDWEEWQGPVPHRAYCPKYLPGVWRFWTMYGTNTLGDWSCHLMDPLFWTLGLGMPESVRADVCGEWTSELHGATFPKGVKTTFTYRTRAGKPFKLVWFDGEACKDVPKPELFKDAPEYFAPTMTKEVAKQKRDGMPNGAFVYGTKGVIEYGHHGANYLRMLPDVTLERLRAENGCPAQKYARNPGISPDEKPFNEFVAAVKGGARPGSDFAYAGMMTQCSLTGVAALFDAGRTLQWDSERAEFKDSPRANARLTAERIPWPS